jgi:hypothetical protein
VILRSAAVLAPNPHTTDPIAAAAISCIPVTPYIARAQSLLLHIVLTAGPCRPPGPPFRFFPGFLSLGDWVARIAALEAVIGLFIELILIASFSRRFLGN